MEREPEWSPGSGLHFSAALLRNGYESALILLSMACERASSTPHEPTPIGGPSSAPLPSRSILRTRVDPVGPPSEVIDPAVYLKRVEQALDRASAKVKQVEAGWAALDDEARVRLRDRCRCGLTRTEFGCN